MIQMNRRNVLKAGLGIAAYGTGLGAAIVSSRTANAANEIELEAVNAKALLDGQHLTDGVMTYRSLGEPDTLMPPTLRVKRGEPFSAKLVNRLNEPTTIHWHGLRIENRMDGVPFLTQPYVYTGDSFDYRFAAPDAGTFWYHPHCNTLTQMGRGMTGMLIVEDPKDPQFDAEIPLNLRDWRLGAKGEFIEQFKPRDAARNGTFGTVRGANWQVQPAYEAPSGGIVRLRLVASDVTRIYQLRLNGADADVIAIDGQPVPNRFRLETAVIGPGQRLDLALRMPDVEGSVVSLLDTRPSTAKTVATFKAIGQSLKHRLEDLPPLSANPWQEPDLKNAEQIPLILSATAEGGAKESFCGSLGYTFWAINRVPWPGDSADPTAPLAELKLGKSYVFNLENLTPHIHPIHLHGMNFQVVSSNMRQVPPLITDTYLAMPDEKVQLSLVADNPGDWVMHCHIIEHQKSGMTSYVRVT